MTRKTDCDIEYFPVKSAYNAAYNLYAKSSIFKKCCVDCTPNSSIYFDSKNKSNYILNLFHFDYKSIFLKNFFRFDKRILTPLKFNEEKINDLIEQNITSNQDLNITANHAIKTNFIKSIREKVNKMYFSIGSDSYSFNENLTLIVFKWVVQSLYSRIFFSKIQLNSLEVAFKKNLPVVFIINSESNLFDLLIVKLTLFANNLKSPQIFRELTEKLKNRILRYLVKINYFQNELLINNKDCNQILNGTYSNDEPIFYKQILTTYLVDYLNKNENIILKNDTKLIDCLISLIENEIVHDLIIVPVDVTYDKKLEEITPWKIIKEFFSSIFLNPKHGQVRLNLSQPFSIKEYVETIRVKFRKHEFSTRCLNFKKHMAYDSFQMTPLMSTSMVSFILLTQYTNGCTFENLCVKFDELKSELSSQYQTGFRCEATAHIVDYTIEILEEYLDLKKDKNQDKNNLHIKPKFNKESLFELFKLSKSILQCYFMHSILANSIKISLNTDFYHLNFHSQNVATKLNENDLMLNSFELIRIFMFDFPPYKKPCETVFSKVFQTINVFMNSDLLIDMKKDKRSIFKNHFILDEEDEDDEYYNCMDSKNDKNIFPSDENLQDPDLQEINQWVSKKNSPIYKLIVNSENVSKLMNYSKVLEPYIEAYINFFSFLKTLNSTISYSENEFDTLHNNFLIHSINSKQIKLVEPTLRFLHLSAKKYAVQMKFVVKSQNSYSLNNLTQMKKVYLTLKNVTHMFQ